MTTSSNHMPFWQHPSWPLAVTLIALITLVRIAVVILSPFNLGPDEAQYWDWSRTFSFGYFSKPPMIAWLIGLETAICGDTEPCIRIASPLIHAGTSLVIFAIARHLFDTPIAFWSSLTFATLPSVSFSSGIISTDVPLLFFWACALWALQRLLDRQDWSSALLLGLVLGFGFMSKYAMIYFLLCLGLFALASEKDRWLLISSKLWAALGITALVISPNVMWNIQNDFSTLDHTAANANWGVELFNPGSLLDFIGDQFGIMGPILFVIFVWSCGALLKQFVKNNTIEPPILFVLCFSLPIITIVTVQSFISRANANWAATTYVAATILVVAWLMRKNRKPLLYASFVLHLCAGVFLYTLTINPALIDQVGLSNAFKRVRGWEDIGAHVQQTAQNLNSQTILTGDRLFFTELLYYTRPRLPSYAFGITMTCQTINMS